MLCQIFFEYLFDHIYSYIYAIYHRLDRSDIYELNIWIFFILAIQPLLFIEPIIYLIYKVCVIILYRLMCSIEDSNLKSFDKSYERDIMESGSVFNEIKIRNNNFDNRKISMISGEWIGRRPYMEDRTLVLDKYGIYGVFDGHGGDKISDFMANNFEEYYDRVLDPKLIIDDKVSEKYIQDTICNLEIDSKKLGLSGGSTCTVVQITKDYLLCANVGDSEAHAFMLDGTIVSLSEEHSFSRFSEYYRYYSHYGEKKLYVGNTIRTRTGLMPTRTLGDFRHKRKDGALIFNPEIKKIFLNSMKWEFIVIGSDGIFDRLTPKTILDELIKTRIMIKKQDIKDNNIFAIYDLSEKKIDRLMLRLQEITTRKSNVYDKIRNIYGGDNCSICILINKNL